MSIPAAQVLDDFSELSLPDARLKRRALRIMERFCQRPEASLPRAMGTEAELEGAYRLLNNPRVKFEDLLAPHVAASWKRAAESDRTWLLSVEDSTELRFNGDLPRKGLGDVSNGGHGFFLHAALLVSATDSNFTPLGIGATELLVRDPKRKPVPRKQRYKDPGRESLRWTRVSEAVDGTAASSGVEVVHVCDREADDYFWFGEIVSRGGRCVVRTSVERRTGVQTGSAATQTYLSDELSTEDPVVTTRDVHFQARTTSGGRRRRDPRAKRTTKLEVRSTNVVLTRPDKTSSTQKSIPLNLVWVTERNPPADEEPIDWKLLTTEPINTPEQVLRVVDAYRARWLVEELFKALKTGCQFERLQLESYHALANALSLNLPVAVQLLRLRSVARDHPRQPASTAMESRHLTVLKMIAKKPDNQWGVRLPRNPKAGDCLLAVARMGGHLKRNGSPGWMTLGRGFETLNQIVEVQSMLKEI